MLRITLKTKRDTNLLMMILVRKAGKIVSDNCKGIIKKLKILGSKYSISRVFEDWIAVFAISISNSVDRTNWDEREQRFLETINRYTPDEQQLLVEASTGLVMALDKECSEGRLTDLLGEVFHGLNLHNKYHGQFFTPFHICEFMGHIALTDGGKDAGTTVRDALCQRGYVTVCEPCVGSGGLVLGFANAMYKQGLNYNKQMVAYCCDIDIKCVYMAYIQLSLYGIPAVVVHGNSLTNEEWSKWYTPVFLMDGWPLRNRDVKK